MPVEEKKTKRLKLSRNPSGSKLRKFLATWGEVLGCGVTSRVASSTAIREVTGRPRADGADKGIVSVAGNLGHLLGQRASCY